MLKVTIDVDKTSINKFKSEVQGFDKTVKAGLKKAMLFAEAEAKQNFNKPGKPNVRTGRLRASIQSGVNGLVGWVGTNVEYAPVQEFGAKIRPIRGKYLKFQIQNQWKSVKEVVVPARPFIGPAVNDNIEKISDIILDTILEAFK